MVFYCGGIKIKVALITRNRAAAATLIHSTLLSQTVKVIVVFIVVFVVVVVVMVLAERCLRAFAKRNFQVPIYVFDFN